MESEKKIKVTILDKCCIKSKTNAKEPAKQYFKVVVTKGMSPVMIIEKLILTEITNKRYNKLGYELIKEFKHLNLYRQTFSIKVETLESAIDYFITNK